MFAAKFLSLVVLAASALAAPKGRIADRLARRADRLRSSRPVGRIAQGDVVEVANASHVEYSSNWAGAVLSTSAVSRLRWFDAWRCAH